MLDLLTGSLLHLSNALLMPVVLALFLLLFWTLILSGGFVREWLERRKAAPVLRDAARELRKDSGSALSWRLLQTVDSGTPKRLVGYIGEDTDDPAAIEHGLSMVENDIAATLARHSFITRIAPILGLMGTLIPLGPALSGLANGNMQALSGNLIVAFTATVIGLLISGISYGMGLARRIWYSRDLTLLEASVAALVDRGVHA